MAQEYDHEREQAMQEWRASPSLQEEFVGDFEAYLAYKKAADAGLVKILSRQTTDCRADAGASPATQYRERTQMFADSGHARVETEYDRMFSRKIATGMHRRDVIREILAEHPGATFATVSVSPGDRG